MNLSDLRTGDGLDNAKVAALLDASLSIIMDTQFRTKGPTNRFQAVLFIEKEGFLPLFEAVLLAERYDLAIMSTKGMSVTASRLLVDRLCGEYNIPLLILHDFDKSGFSICGTLTRNTPRYTFKNQIEVIDLGLRLEDVRKHQLQSESVSYRKSDPAPNLRENGALEDEIAFLCSQQSSWAGYSGQRVELNAFASDDFVAWIEGKLKKHGIKKVVPDEATLDLAFRRAAAITNINKLLPGLVKKEIAGAKVPANIAKEVEQNLRDNPEMPWDAAIAEIAKNQICKK